MSGQRQLGAVGRTRSADDLPGFHGAAIRREGLATSAVARSRPSARAWGPCSDARDEGVSGRCAWRGGWSTPAPRRTCRGPCRPRRKRVAYPSSKRSGRASVNAPSRAGGAAAASPGQ
jgi:hypothetical protein